MATKAAICPHASHTIKWLQPQPHRVCIHQNVCQFLVYNGSHTCCTFSNHADHSFQPLRKPCCRNSECVHKHIVQTVVNPGQMKLLFQPYYKTRPRTYTLKIIQCVTLPQLFETCPLSRNTAVINCILRAWNGQCLLHRTHQHLFCSLSQPG